MSLRSPSSVDAAARDAHVQARRHLRILIGKALAYFAQHQDDHLTLIRAHLLDLIDARPPQAQAKNLRSAWSALDKQAPVFNGAFEAALAQSIDEELRLVLPEVPGSGFHE